MDRLLQVTATIERDAQELTVNIPIDAYAIKRYNNLVTAYYFELILLYGDAGGDNGLRTEDTASALYLVGESYTPACRLSMVLPEQPWIALLKVSCIEGNEPAAHPKLYGMKTVACGGE